ncbi:U3 snoRNP protein [Elasticomyces elasticus]|nr:U3 snoRNP protein [Elasticomyces elasticus]KAK3646746.1 U3 snoRNP protein [Elasticomyces elasticus]KAK4905638.1 U3 snoRNP protein [Elasticomyces elasticus]KAK5749055.1 U3 snoRNP protein [Elasticomyces elasticus]
MAMQDVKRRKLDHVSSEVDEDASFASFGHSDEHDADQDIDGEENDVLEDDDMSDGAADLDDADDGKNEQRNTLPGTLDEDPAVGLKAKQNRTDSAKTRHATLEAGGSAYVAGAFKSNVFKLQVDELLEQVRPRRGKREEVAEQALHALRKTLDSVAAREARLVEASEQQLLKDSAVRVPFPDQRPPKDAKYKLMFAKPQGANVVGGYALKTSVRSKETVSIDMIVTMPSSGFQEKDYLNHRYFYKRAYYVACVAAALKAEYSSEYDINFADLHDDHLKPILVVTPRTSLSGKDAMKTAPRWRIHIIPSVGADTFPAEKLSPAKNCVRAADDTKVAPTPFYNSSLRSDMLMPSYLKLLNRAANDCDGFRDACLLGGTWLRQRGFGGRLSAGGFGNFEWATLVALLLQGGGPSGKPILSEGYSSYQLFKATLQVLAMKDLAKSALVIGAGEAASIGDGLPMLWDAARTHNVLYKVTPWAYRQLRQDARTSLAMLGDQLYDGFDATFIMRTDSPLLRYDSTVHIPVSTLPTESDGYQKLYNVLKRGLVDRARLVSIKPPSSSSWQLGSPRANSDGITLIGLVVNPETVNRTVDHGPPAESKTEAAAFRKFWGEKAELRRFKDGSITESLVWTAAEQTVLEQIVRFLIGRHISPDAGQQASFVGHGFSRLLRQGVSMVAFQPLMEAYKQLENDIRGLEGMPLSVRQIMPADSQLRYSSVLPPADVTGRQYRRPANTVIQFEGSTRWPDDVVAIQRTKIAFLLKLSSLLQEANTAVTARVGLENQDDDVLNQGYLDIKYDSGAAFRMRIHHDREQTLLERQLKDKTTAPSFKESTARALAIYKRDYHKITAHTQAVARLCSRHPALSGTIRLLKKWFSSHLLGNHIAEEVIELMAARTFVQPWPWQTPSSVQTGFLRTLHWLARWDWRAEPLIVDLSGTGELKPAEVQGIKTRFEAWRKLDPSLNRIVMFAASNLDHDGTTWTDGRPQRVIAGRMTALAKAVCAEVEEQLSALEPAGLFVSPLEDYDFVLHLDHSLSSGGKKRRGAANGTTFKNIELAAQDDDSMIGFDAAQLFFTELESLYGSSILFFSGGSERHAIGGLWSPQTAPRAWKMNLAYSTIPRKVRVTEKEENVRAEVNKQSILAEIVRLGGGLIERVDVRS